jgi:hypothetical protein
MARLGGVARWLPGSRRTHPGNGSQQFQGPALQRGQEKPPTRGGREVGGRLRRVTSVCRSTHGPCAHCQRRPKDRQPGNASKRKECAAFAPLPFVGEGLGGRRNSVMAVAVAAQAGDLAGNHRPAVLLDFAVVALAETADAHHVRQGDADHAKHHEQDNDPVGQVVFQ